MRPATSLIGFSSGKRPVDAVRVSYAMPVAPDFQTLGLRLVGGEVEISEEQMICA